MHQMNHYRKCKPKERKNVLNLLQNVQGKVDRRKREGLGFIASLTTLCRRIWIAPEAVSSHVCIILHIGVKTSKIVLD